MPNDLTQKGIYFTIWQCFDDGESDWRSLCDCESPQAVASIVLALMASDRRKPLALKVVPRMEVQS